FYVPSWKRSIIPAGPSVEDSGTWLIFSDQSGVGNNLLKSLRDRNVETIVVEAGEQFATLSDSTYKIDARRPEDYKALVNELKQKGKTPNKIVHLWLVDPAEPSANVEQQDRGY